jgi:dihydrofolate reductase
MPKLIAFNSVTLDGYFTGGGGDMSWAHKDPNDTEWSTFVRNNASSDAALLFGRVTFQLMASFWPTSFAKQRDPTVADRMNNAKKIVFSKTLTEVTWSNTTLLKDNLIDEVRKLKQAEDAAILGSGTLVKQLTEERLIDEYHFVLNPIALGQGRTLFDGVKNRLNLKLGNTRTFQNGNVVLVYTL